MIFKPKNRDEKQDLRLLCEFLEKDVSKDTWVLSVRKAAIAEGKSQCLNKKAPPLCFKPIASQSFQ